MLVNLQIMPDGTSTYADFVGLDLALTGLSEGFSLQARL